MFVGAAVAGLVIMAANGVKARGALLRDVSCYLIAVGTVGLVLASGSVTWATAVALLLMYLLFVAVVLAADIHHIWHSRFRRASSAVSACTWNAAAHSPCTPVQAARESASGRVLAYNQIRNDSSDRPCPVQTLL